MERYRSRRPSRTSYGYLVPAEARMRGWRCHNNGCGVGDEPAPRWWPHPCPECGGPTDPQFEEPWEHQAEEYRIQRDLLSADWYTRTAAELKRHIWAYEDALSRQDGEAAQHAWRAFRRTRRQQRERGEDWRVTSARFHLVMIAARADDIDGAAEELREWYPDVDTRDLEDHNDRRTDTRNFVSACSDVLEREASIGHPEEAGIDRAMRDVADRAEDMLTRAHHAGFQRIREIRARRRTEDAIDRTRRSAGPAGDRLPPIRAAVRSAVASMPPARLRALVEAPGRLDPRSATALADAVLDAAETHDDPRALDALIRRLAVDGALPDLLHLLRARRHVVDGALDEAMLELAQAVRLTGRPGPVLGPLIHATHGRVRVLRDPDALDAGIADCRAGRRLGSRWWRRTTAADTDLARLLLWRASQAGAGPGRWAADVAEAVRLTRRRCRPWRGPGIEDRLVLHEALGARDGVTGRGSPERRRKAWRAAVGTAGSTAERARLATAWVAWAVGTRDPELAAEAYQCLVALLPLDAAGRHGPRAKERVLAAAQEHIEDAGYWLARNRRYREAVVTLETGRAIALTESIGGAGGGAPAPAVEYRDVTAATGDGALLYIAAAKAGGYALIVAASHDPQFVELPRLDRAGVAALLGPALAGLADRHAGAPARDLGPVAAPSDPVGAVLQTLWVSGMRDLLLDKARGQIVTLIPVGLLSLLPLHAAGEPGTPAGEPGTPGGEPGTSGGEPGTSGGEPGTPGGGVEGWHAGRFSAIRYAPNARGLRRCQDAARDLGNRPQRLFAVDAPGGPGAGAGAHLHHVARETDAVARRWTGPAATVTHNCTWAEFRDRADEHSVWHLACHGSAQPESILDTRLYFADRAVTLGELRAHLPPGRRRLAVLSACETNLTELTAPNEVVGLPSALLQVGFAGVIASSWKVDDLATAYLMTAFYHQWRREGHQPAIALNLAQRWLRGATRAELTELLPGTQPAGDARCPYGHPRYWAAFAFTGA